MCPCQQGLSDSSTFVHQYVPIAIAAGTGFGVYKVLDGKDNGVKVASSVFSSIAGYFLSTMMLKKMYS